MTAESVEVLLEVMGNLLARKVTLDKLLGIAKGTCFEMRARKDRPLC